MLSALEQFNWVDIFVVIVLLRISYVAIKSGLAAEFFKLLGTTLAVYVSLHYYIILSDSICSRIGTKYISLEVLTFIVFCALAIFAYLVFVLLRKIFSWCFKMEAASQLDKWGGFAVGLIRGILLASFLVFILTLFPVDYFQNSVKNAYSEKRLVKITPITYGLLWNGIMSKFMANEKFNEGIYRIKSNPAGK